MFAQRKSITWIIAVVLLLLPLLSACGNSQKAAAVQENGLPTPGRIQPMDYQNNFVQKKTAHLLIDVRTPEEFATGIIAGAVNIPVDQLSQRLSEVPKDQPVVLYCRSGNRSNQAAQILGDAGYTQVYDLGGISQWQSAGMPVQ